MTDFQTTLAQKFATIGDVTRLAQATPLTALGRSRSDLFGRFGSIDLGGFTHGDVADPPPVTVAPLTPIDAGAFIHAVSETPEQALAAAVHAARTAFEAIPVAQNGDVIDASIPNGFRSAMITLLSLADSVVQRYAQRPRQTAPPPAPPQNLPPPTPPRRPPFETPPIFVPPRDREPVEVGPGIRFDPGIIRIDPATLGTIAREPGVSDPNPVDTGLADRSGGLPAVDFGGRIFEPITSTHPETGVETTVLVERAGSAVDTGTAAAAGAVGTGIAALSPVSGGGFLLATSPVGEAAAGLGSVAANLGSGLGLR